MSRVCGQSQNYTFQHLTTRDGLAADKVTGILHDSRGFTWIGTNKGLQRFDGNSFTDVPYGKEYFYHSMESATTFIPVLEDKNGSIWVSSTNDISVYSPFTGKINHIQIEDDINNEGFDHIQSLCKDNEGDVWIITALNLYKYNAQLQRPVLWLSLGNKPCPSTKLMFDASRKGLWAIRDDRIVFLNISQKNTGTSFDNYCSALNPLNVSYSWIDSKQNIWVSDWGGEILKVNCVSKKSKTYKLQSFKQSNAPDIICGNSFIEDNSGTIWLATSYGGLLYHDDSTDEFKYIVSNNNHPFGLHYDFDINSLSKDKDGNIWAGTDKGISIFTPLRQPFRTIDEDNRSNIFKTTEILQIAETSSGNILIGTWGNGWCIYDKDFRFKKYFFYKFPPGEGDYRKNEVWCFAEAEDGKIWIGHQHGLLGIYDTVNKSMKYINNPGFNFKTIRIIRPDSHGNMWFGLNSGSLGKWDKIKNKFIFYNDILPPRNDEAQTPITDILVCPDQKIWLSTYTNGLYCFDARKEKVVEHYMNKNAAAINENAISSLTRINDSVIGISTYAKGFYLFNQLQKTFSSFSDKNGLPTNEVLGIEQDEQKNTWIVTPEGLYRKNNSDNKTVSFYEEDGLLEKHFIQRIFKLSDGRMVVPTSTGLVYFSPEDIVVKNEDPRIHFASFKIFDRPLLIDSLLQGRKTVYLNYDQNFITIGYASRNFMERNATGFYYQLTGVDKDWVNAGSRRFASYTGLAPGYYTFKVKSQSRDGIFSKDISTLRIYIKPPWWRTPWAYASYIIILFVMGNFIYINRIRRLRKKQESEIKAIVTTQEEERKRISQDLHDDVGTKLSALKLFISSLYNKAAEINNNEMKSLAKNSDQIITESIQDVRQLLLNLSPAVLEEFGYRAAVESLISKINETHFIKFTLIVFDIDNRLKEDYELILYRITQELINNVLKHAEATTVTLQLFRRDNKIILMMEDDGKGFNVNMHRNGYGLKNLYARTKLMQGTISIDSWPGRGTNILIEIPYNI